MNPLRVLLIEDEDQVRDLLCLRLSGEQHKVVAAGTGRGGISLLENHVFDAALLDINLPDMSGIEVLEAIKDRDASIDAVMMTGHPQIETAVQALRLGACDYLMKPIDWTETRHVFQRIVERRYLLAEVSSLRDRLGEAVPAGELIGASDPLRRLKQTIAKVATTDTTILIEGESGTGKELVAGAIHRLSLRCNGPFVPVNCSAIPPDLMESELFGHVKGAFSGATADSKGLFRSAENGTLFLDEVGDLPLQLQPKLLRVLQEKELRPVGGGQAQKINVRVVAATNHNLESDVRNGKFRQDLFFRLNVVRLEPPPLRFIREDVPLLVMNCARRFNRTFGRQVQGISKEAIASLMAYDFPGNVRELENIIERAYAMGANDEIGLDDLPSLNASVAAASRESPLRHIETVERDLIAETLRQYPNKQEAARKLGLSERTLYRRLKSLGLA